MPASIAPVDELCCGPARLHAPTDGTVCGWPLRTTLAEPADAVPASVAWPACAGAVTSTANTTTTATIANVLMPRMIDPLSVLSSGWTEMRRGTIHRAGRIGTQSGELWRLSVRC